MVKRVMGGILDWLFGEKCPCGSRSGDWADHLGHPPCWPKIDAYIKRGEDDLRRRSLGCCIPETDLAS